MSHRADEIRKRLAKRRKQQPGPKRPAAVQTAQKKQKLPAWQAVKEQEKHRLLPSYETEHPPEFNGRHPLINTNSIILKCLLAACLVLISAIAYKTDKQPLAQIKPAIAQTFQKEFQFAAVSHWFESAFGNPLAFLTPGTKKKGGQVAVSHDLAVPAAGKIQEDFQNNGEGVIVETASDTIDSVKEGYVVEVNKDKKTGLTVKVQHADNTCSIYGQLKDVNVSLYDFIDKGKKIGSIKLDDKNKGQYYFAMQEGDKFIDPIQVITFDE
ncbi:M23 family metallopeptidase [Bacillus sp. ISL-51]|uniref:M23 family metallopeptidase n=1 Tax=unclassified Bacillus (in: firmicutes) TaxID=185979 RepID=UPI001BEB4FE6|nr:MULTISPECIES: M23 family metallopeptidase [unclassified Bacillus (in: firmicutes)]MBT2574239.1 M23 family metallopeptidase [Bacillus sp. ISL-51]MBT2633058.1 M23 family metallopeptidase [Bacillus sp. ISL-26]